jgi:hypothetical protein
VSFIRFPTPKVFDETAGGIAPTDFPGMRRVFQIGVFWISGTWRQLPGEVQPPSLNAPARYPVCDGFIRVTLGSRLEAGIKRGSPLGDRAFIGFSSHQERSPFAGMSTQRERLFFKRVFYILFPRAGSMPGIVWDESNFAVGNSEFTQYTGNELAECGIFHDNDNGNGLLSRH